MRKLIGMVFQKPNPFPKSIYDNVAFGPRILGRKDDLDATVEKALRGAALWDEVKDRLDSNAFGLSGGQQQRLCIARCIAVEPDAILMDEPCSALDPISTGKIEDLMIELKKEFSIVIVTHNMQQAARVSDRTAFLMVELDADEDNRWGRLVEYDETEKIFTNPADKRTEDYVSGKVGLMARGRAVRVHYQEELERLEASALGGLDLVSAALERTMEAVEHQDVELAQLVDRRRRPHRRPLPGGAPEPDHAAGDAVAGGDRPAADLGPAARAEEHRADGRPVREHLQADPADRQRAAGRRRRWSS